MWSLGRTGLSSLTIVVASAGCGGEEVRVHVDSYPADTPPSRGESLCFLSSKDASLSKRTRHREIVAICEEVLEDVGLSVVPAAIAGCHPVKIAWSLKTGPTVNDGETCFGDSLMFCSASSATYYNKAFGVRVSEPHTGRPVFEAQARMSTYNPDFTDMTAYAMCRAIFTHYPRRVPGQSFIVELPDE